MAWKGGRLMAYDYDTLRHKVKDRIWYPNKDKDGDEDAFAYLVDTPYTLGHSQLVLKISKSTEEKDNFANVSKHVAKCIKTLSTKLHCQSKKWPQLAKYTLTSDSYLKTLVLRVSADEEDDTYKVHLVPYFTSHLNATRKLFRAIHNKEEGIGGLVHWLGQREVFGEYDMRDGRDDPIVKERIKSFKLQDLATFLLSGKER
jgi:hypothetical protein